MPNKMVILAVVALLLPAIYLLSIGFSRIGERPVSFFIAPSSAVVTVDEKVISGDVVYISEGSYTVEVFSDGFRPVTESLVVTENTEPVVVALTPVTEEAWLSGAGDPAYLRVEAEVGRVVAERSAELVSENPILEFLPYKGVLFDIDYGPIVDGKLSLVVTLHDQSGKDLLEPLIGSWGFDVSDYSIEYQEATLQVSE